MSELTHSTPAIGGLGSPKAFRLYKRLGGAALYGAPLLYLYNKLQDIGSYVQNIDPDKPDERLLVTPADADTKAVEKQRAQYLQDLLSAPAKEPGEQVVTASARDFLEKRAELQGMEKEAFGFLKRLFNPMAKAVARAEKAVAAAKQHGLIDPAELQNISSIVKQHAMINPRAGKAVSQAVETGILDPKQLGRIGAQAARNAPQSLGSKMLTPGGLLVGGSLIGLGTLAEPLAQRLGYKGREAFYSGITGLPERVRMDELAAESFAKEVGKEVGKSTIGLAGDILSKTFKYPMDMIQNVERQDLLSQLRSEDEVLAKADPEQVDEAFHTMTRFAPTLATDKNAVKTFLRESVLYGTGPNFTTIKQLADAEGAVNRPPAVVVKR